IVYFVILGFLGVNSNPFYSIANPVIMASCLSLALKEIEMKTTERIGYKKGFELILLSGIIATVLFSVFFITYYVYMPDFSEALLKKIGNFANTGGVFLTVVIMGVVTSLAVGFALMQLNKNRLNRDSTRVHT